jgi:hypothetical protein
MTDSEKTEFANMRKLVANVGGRSSLHAIAEIPSLSPSDQVSQRGAGRARTRFFEHVGSSSTGAASFREAAKQYASDQREIIKQVRKTLKF